jgi:hypothetical protein
VVQTIRITSLYLGAAHRCFNHTINFSDFGHRQSAVINFDYSQRTCFNSPPIFSVMHILCCDFISDGRTAQKFLEGIPCRGPCNLSTLILTNNPLSIGQNSKVTPRPNFWCPPAFGPVAFTCGLSPDSEWISAGLCRDLPDSDVAVGTHNGPTIHTYHMDPVPIPALLPHTLSARAILE